MAALILAQLFLAMWCVLDIDCPGEPRSDHLQLSWQQRQGARVERQRQCYNLKRPCLGGGAIICGTLEMISAIDVVFDIYGTGSEAASHHFFYFFIVAAIT